MNKIPMTPEGKKKLEKEIERLLKVERPAIIQAIAEARAHGDLSENAEYSAAKEKQSFNEGRIQHISHVLSLAEVIDPSKITSEKIMFGATVKILDTDTEKEITYKLVGEMESDVPNGAISIKTPLAQSLMGKYVGDAVEFKTAKTEKIYEILEVRYE